MSDLHQITISYTPPFDWEFLLSYLSARATAGVEMIEHNRYFRSVEIEQSHGTLSVEHDPRETCLVVRISKNLSEHVELIRNRIRRIFDVDADLTHIRAILGRDPWISPFLKRSPGLRVPGAWCSFELLVRTIVGQQVSVKGASTIMGRIAARCGRVLHNQNGLGYLFPTPQAIATGDLSSIGMPGKRILTLQNIARSIANNQLAIGFDIAPNTVKAALLQHSGIGPWTAEYFALRALGDSDAWPATDLVLRRAIEARSKSQQASIESWRPFRGYAAMYLWHNSAELNHRN